MAEFKNISRRGFVKGAGVAALGVGASGLLSACGGGNGDVTNLRVATGIGGSVLFDVDEKGNPVGFEYELLTRIEKLLPQYKFNYEPIIMTTQLPEIAAGRIDIVSHDYEDNQERRQNYLFAETPHWFTEQVFFVLTSNTTIKSTEKEFSDDLIGKTVVTFPSSNSAYALEQWNIKNPTKQVKLDYATAYEVLIADLSTGKADAVLFDTSAAPFLAQYGLNVKAVTTAPFVKVGVFYIFPKDRTEVKAAVDGALKTLDENGTIAKLQQIVKSWQSKPGTSAQPDWSVVA
jgi:L-cystine transport system substrate-binding protein